MAKLKIGDEWWTTPAEGENGEVIMVTGRRLGEDVIASGKFNERVEVTWKYDAMPDGLPDNATAKLMEQVDTALKDAFSGDRTIAIITGIYTGNGERNWVLYASSLPIFEKIFNKALSSFELLPLSLYVEKDPEWNEYGEMKSQTEIMDGE